MIVETAPAKINLALHVRFRRDDGYHEIETLFAFIEHGDEVRLEPGAPGCTIEGPFADALAGAAGDNLVSRASRAYARAFGVADNAAFTLVKRLPVASGIGGGSADAAGALRALARRDRVDPEDPRLFACADALGSDVPACLFGRNALGRGRGERLDPLEGLAGMPVLLVNPGVAVSTATVFGGWDGCDRGAIGDGDLLDRARQGRNDLEAPARAVAPTIGDALALLGEGGEARLVRMSGSGATCFALFDDAAARSAAAGRVRRARPDWWQLESRLV